MKKQLRTSKLTERKALSPQEWTELSAAICKQIIESNEFKQAKSIGLYASLNNEVDCKPILKAALEQGKTCGFPRTEAGELYFHKVYSSEELNQGNYKIQEPSSNSPVIEAKDLDIILCPGAVFDKKGNRIGYGMGYFDKFLKSTSALKIGLAFSFQIVDDVPAEDHDVPMDIIVTEKGLIHP